LFLEDNLCFAECTPELPGCPRASSSIAGCHLLTVKRLSVAEPRGAGISCCVSVSVVLLRQLVVPRMGWGWRSFATTSLWLLIFMILLFNGSFVGLHCECEYVSGFQFSYRRVNIFPSSSNVCLILFYIFCSLPSSPVWGHVCRPNLPPWSVAFSIYLSICGLPFFGANLLTQDDGQQVSWLQTFAAYFEDARREAENENW